MSTRTPAKTKASHEGISFASALREAVACGVILLDAQGTRITCINDEARQILSLPANLECGEPIEILPAPLQYLAREALASGTPISGRQIELQPVGSQLVTVRVSVVPTRPGAAEAGFLIVVNDITSAIRLEQNFQHLDRLASIGTLSASMAHEIRNALQAAKTFFDLLFEKHQDAELVGVARREISRIEAIVSRMLRFVGHTEPTFRAVHLHEVLEHSLRLVHPQMEDKLISLKRSFQAAPDQVNGDDVQLQQAFVNLFLNALEAMGPNGTLTVATSIIAPGPGLAGQKGLVAERQLGLTIQDSGAGIPAENLARLFELFFTTKPNGTGLGLPITKRIIQEHCGDISVQSEPGKGTTFRIILPLLAPPS